MEGATISAIEEGKPVAPGRWIRRLPAEDLAWLGAVAAVLLLYAAIEWASPRLSGLYPESPYPFFPQFQLSFVQREPLETVRFALAAAAPLALAAVVIALGSRLPGRRALDLPIILIQLAGIAFVVWTTLKQRENVTYYFLGAFGPLLLPPGNLIAGPAIGLALTLTALGWDGPAITRARELAGGLGGRAGVALAAAIVLTALWLLPGVITEGGLAESGQIPPGHVPIQFDDFVAASNGRTPLVDYIPYYASLLPIALAPVWPLFDYSVGSFTAIMCLLSLLGLVATYGAFLQVTRRPWPALALYVPWLATALQPWRVDGAVREFNGLYYATLPARYLGPLVVIWLCARHLRRGSPPVWALFGAAGLTILNNFEFGGACLIALVLALCFGADRELPLRAWIRTHATEAAAGLAGALVLVSAAILLRTGELPDFGLLGWVAQLARHGYGLIAIPPWGLHWVLYVTYAAAILTAAVRFANRAPDRALTGMLGFAGVFGLATGGYFAGRSVPWQLWGLFPAWGFALALLAWTAWLALRSARAGRSSLRRVIVAAFTALAGFGVMVASIDRLPVPWDQIERIADSGQVIPDARRPFIESRTEPGDRVLIVGWVLDHRLAERTGIVNVSPWFSAGALLGPNETRRALEQLEEEDDPRAFVSPDRPDSLVGLMARVAAIMRDRGYVPVARDPTTGVVEWQLQDRR